tara:strand:- start:258 stop:518 length:261 start_codon:yes stop_codon:yes gene_type:complete
LGKYVADRDFIEDEPSEKRIREILVDYNNNIKQFECQNNRSAGRRARANLLELYHLCRLRRKEILERNKEISWHVHESWNNLEQGE